MAKTIYTVLGVASGTDKKGKDITILHLQRPFSDYECENKTCIGMAVQSEYVRSALLVKTGDKVNLVYEPGFEGKAVVSDVEIIGK